MEFNDPQRRCLLSKHGECRKSPASGDRPHRSPRRRGNRFTAVERDRAGQPACWGILHGNRDRASRGVDGSSLCLEPPSAWLASTSGTSFCRRRTPRTLPCGRSGDLNSKIAGLRPQSTDVGSEPRERLDRPPTGSRCRHCGWHLTGNAPRAERQDCAGHKAHSRRLQPGQGAHPDQARGLHRARAQRWAAAA